MIVYTEPEKAQPGWRPASIDGDPADWPVIESMGEPYRNPDFPGDTFIGARLVGEEEPREMLIGVPCNFWIDPSEGEGVPVAAPA